MVTPSTDFLLEMPAGCDAVNSVEQPLLPRGKGPSSGFIWVCITSREGRAAGAQLCSPPAALPPCPGHVLQSLHSPDCVPANPLSPLQPAAFFGYTWGWPGCRPLPAGPPQRGWGEGGCTPCQRSATVTFPGSA